MHGCTDIPRCSCTGRGSVDDPLEDLESDAAPVVKRALALTLVPGVGDTAVF